MLRNVLHSFFKKIFFLFFIGFHSLGTLQASLALEELNSLNNEPIDWGQFNQYPALLVIAPQHDDLQPSIDFFHQLSQNFGDRAHLLVSPDLPFYMTQNMLRSKLEQTIEKEAQGRVLLDWNQKAADFLFAEENPQSVVVVLQKDGSLLARYYYKNAAKAFDFIKTTFDSMLSSSSPLWSKLEFPELAEKAL